MSSHETQFSQSLSFHKAMPLDNMTLEHLCDVEIPHCVHPNLLEKMMHCLDEHKKSIIILYAISEDLHIHIFCNLINLCGKKKITYRLKSKDHWIQSLARLLLRQWMSIISTATWVFAHFRLIQHLKKKKKNLQQTEFFSPKPAN